MRSFARATYLGSSSFAMLFLPEFMAAMLVVPVPANGSRTVSPTNENRRINRSASSAGYGAGWPLRVDSPLISVHEVFSHCCISRLVRTERALCIGDGERYEPPLRRKRMYSKSFLTIAPG